MGKATVGEYVFAATLGLLAFLLWWVALGFEVKFGDLATWVGAIGTVGTLIGTIILSARDVKSRERYSINRARLVAGSLVLRIRLAKSIVDGAIDCLRVFPGDDSQRHEFMKIKLMLDSLHLWTTDEVTPIADISPSLATNLAGVSSSLGAGLRGFSVLGGMLGADHEIVRFLAVGMCGPWAFTAQQLDGLADQCETLALQNF